MKPRIGDIMFNSSSPPRMARFWAAVMHYEIQELDETFAAIVDPERQSPRFCFQQLVVPKTDRNRIHLDLYVADIESEVERILALKQESDELIATVFAPISGILRGDGVESSSYSAF